MRYHTCKYVIYREKGTLWMILRLLISDFEIGKLSLLLSRLSVIIASKNKKRSQRFKIQEALNTLCWPRISRKQRRQPYNHKELSITWMSFKVGSPPKSLDKGSGWLTDTLTLILWDSKQRMQSYCVRHLTCRNHEEMNLCCFKLLS